MRKLYLISQCVEQKASYSIFHFKGFYMGQKINEVCIKRDEVKFNINECYLLELKCLSVKNTKLHGEVTRFKKLFN